MGVIFSQALDSIEEYIQKPLVNIIDGKSQLHIRMLNVTLHGVIRIFRSKGR